MELIAAILIAGPLGYFGGRRGLALYLGLWVIIFPIQTIVVHADNADDIAVSYFVLNALILMVGIGLNRLGSRLRSRRDRRHHETGRPGRYPAGVVATHGHDVTVPRVGEGDA